MQLATSSTEDPGTFAPSPQVVRCACAVCGAHSNAVKTFRITGSCPNCGSFDLEQVEGAAPVGGPIAA